MNVYVMPGATTDSFNQEESNQPLKAERTDRKRLGLWEHGWVAVSIPNCKTLNLLFKIIKFPYCLSHCWLGILVNAAESIPNIPFFPALHSGPPCMIHGTSSMMSTPRALIPIMQFVAYFIYYPFPFYNGSPTMSDLFPIILPTSRKLSGT